MIPNKISKRKLFLLIGDIIIIILSLDLAYIIRLKGTFRFLEPTHFIETVILIFLLLNRPRNDQVNFLNACDVAIVSLVAGMKGVSVPSRIYNIMAAGKPIIAIADSQLIALVI